MGVRRRNSSASQARAEHGLAGRDYLPALSSATYDANQRLTSWGSSTPSYDDNGNLTGDGTNTYLWDSRNRLVRFLRGGQGGGRAVRRIIIRNWLRIFNPCVFM